MPGKAISFTLILQNAPAGKMSTFVNSHLCDKRCHLEGGFHLSNVDDLPAVNKDEVNIPFRDNAAKIFSKSVNVEKRRLTSNHYKYSMQLWMNYVP